MEERLNQVQTNLPILVIADIHGFGHLYLKAIEYAKQYLKETKQQEDFIIVTLGDYVDNGPDVPQTLETLIKSHQQYKGKIFSIIGNHDLTMLNSLDGEIFRARPFDWWSKWNKEDNYFEYSYPKTWEQYKASDKQSFLQNFPKSHFQFLQSLPWYFIVNNYLFVHAGILRTFNISLIDQLNQLKLKDLDFLKEGKLPLQIRGRVAVEFNDSDAGCIVVSGHHRVMEENAFQPYYFIQESNRLILDAAVSEKNKLQCAILQSDAQSLEKEENFPYIFEVS